MALTNARDILNKKILGTGGGVPSADEIPIDIEGLSATKLSVGLQEIVLDIGQLSSSVLTINGEINDINEKIDDITELSTTEHVVGKWIDDSDLYEMTVTKSNQATGNQTIVDLTSLSIKDVISIDGLIVDSGNAIPFGFKTDVVTFFAAAYYRSSDKTLRTVLGSSYDGVDVIATIRYTKTPLVESRKRTTKKK